SRASPRRTTAAPGRRSARAGGRRGSRWRRAASRRAAPSRPAPAASRRRDPSGSSRRPCRTRPRSPTWQTPPPRRSPRRHPLGVAQIGGGVRLGLCLGLVARDVRDVIRRLALALLALGLLGVELVGLALVLEPETLGRVVEAQVHVGRREQLDPRALRGDLVLLGVVRGHLLDDDLAA